MKKIITFLVFLVIGLTLVFLGENLIEQMTQGISNGLGIPFLGVDIFFCVILLAIGIVLIVNGGDYFVDAATWIAKVSGIPTFIIGATIVSLATTLPEILVSSIGSAQGAVNLAIGNAVGSVNANVALIMGVSLLCLPGVFARKQYMPKAIILLVAVGTLWACCSGGSLSLGLAFVVLAVFIVFIIENILSAKRDSKPAEGENKKEERYKPKDKKEIWSNIGMFLIGAGGIAGGAMLLSTYGENLAYDLGSLAKVPGDVMESIVGVTIIAVGTSLPELTTTIIAVRKKQSDLSAGNIIGANVIDITLILPLCSFISGGNLPVNLQTLRFDLPFCLLVCSIALIPAMICGKFKKWQGATLLACYAGYLTILMLNTFGVIAWF